MTSILTAVTALALAVASASAPTSSSAEASASPADARTRASTAEGVGRDGRSARWAWPLTPHTVVRPFDPPAHTWGAGHRGVDLQAPVGTLVRSPSDGVVSFVGVIAGKSVVVVEHAGGLRSTFEPVAPLVEAGSAVTRGQSIGTVLPGGHCPPNFCLHWGVIRGQTYLNPLSFVGAGPVILLPEG